MNKVTIKKGDTVKIMKGKDGGKTGKVNAVNYKNNTILVEGLNLVKKTVKPRKQGEKGQIISVARPVRRANVMVVCGSCGKSARMGYRLLDKNVKERYCKKCNAKV